MHPSLTRFACASRIDSARYWYASPFLQSASASGNRRRVGFEHAAAVTRRTSPRCIAELDQRFIETGGVTPSQRARIVEIRIMWTVVALGFASGA